MTKSEETNFPIGHDVEKEISCKVENGTPYLTSSQNHKDDELSKNTKMKTLDKKWIIIGLAYANFWTAACVSLQAPFFPEEAESKGASPTVYGFIFGVFELVCVLMSPIYARLMPPLKPRTLAIVGVVFEGIVCTIFGAIDAIPPGNVYISMAFIVRILEGFSAAAIFTASFTILSIEFRENVATSFSLNETAFGFGLIAGPSIGGFLFQLGGFPLPFIVCGACLLTAGLLLTFALPKAAKLEPIPTRNYKAFLLNCDIILFTVAIITTLTIIGFNAATLEPHLRVFNLQPSILGLIFVITGGMYAITTPLWGAFLDKGLSPNIVTIIGYTMTSVGLLFIGPVPFLPIPLTLWLVIVSLIICGLGMAAKLVAAFVGGLKSTQERGFPDNLATFSMVSGLFSSACSAGAFIGPTVGGALLDNVGYENGTYVILGIELFFLFVEIFRQTFRWRTRGRKLTEKSPLLGESTNKKDLE